MCGWWFIQGACKKTSSLSAYRVRLLKAESAVAADRLLRTHCLLRRERRQLGSSLEQCRRKLAHHTRFTHHFPNVWPLAAVEAMLLPWASLICRKAFLVMSGTNHKSPSQPPRLEKRCRWWPWLADVKATVAGVRVPRPHRFLAPTLWCCGYVMKKWEREMPAYFTYCSANDASLLVEQKQRELRNVVFFS